jgi:5'-nucleotidase
MVPILRDAIRVDVACCGNHGALFLKYIELTEDFDFGVEQLMYLVEQCGFPWLIGNVFDGEKPLGNALQTYLLTASNGIKIGLMGLVEKYLMSPDEAY